MFLEAEKLDQRVLEHRKHLDDALLQHQEALQLHAQAEAKYCLALDQEKAAQAQLNQLLCQEDGLKGMFLRRTQLSLTITIDWAGQFKSTLQAFRQEQSQVQQKLIEARARAASIESLRDKNQSIQLQLDGLEIERAALLREKSQAPTITMKKEAAPVESSGYTGPKGALRNGGGSGRNASSLSVTTAKLPGQSIKLQRKRSTGATSTDAPPPLGSSVSALSSGERALQRQQNVQRRHDDDLWW